MKKEQAVFHKSVIGFALMVITLWGCKDNINKVGLGLLPVGDLVKVAQVVEKSNINAFTVLDGNQRTDKPIYNLLGTFNDPVFGKTTADFACQFRLSKYPDFSQNAKADSLVLYLLYKEHYGDTITPQHLNVYELTSDLNIDTKYYQDVDLKGLTQGIPLASVEYVPKFKLDSLTVATLTKTDPKDTVIQEIAFKLPMSLANRLMAADSLTMSDNDRFLQFFKGLYVEAGDLNQGGSLMSIYTLAAGSYMVMHYHNDVSDSLTYTYGINENSARVTRFSHDYSKTTFYAQLQNPETPDSLIYLQTTGGLRAKILIPDLGNWSDSTNIAIYGAELIFQVDTTASDFRKYLMPNQLVLTAIDKDGKEYLPSDVAFSSVYYGGTYNSTDNTYKFNLVKHLQEIIAKKKDNYGFYLSTAFRSATSRRVVLKGPGSKDGIRMNITYSKIKE